MPRFSIVALPVGGRVEVDGVDVTDQVDGVELTFARARPTVLTLHHAGIAGPIEGDGIVRVVEHVDRDPAEVICDFLAHVDPDELDRDALDSADASMSLTKTMLQVLTAYAKGEPWPAPT